GCGRRGRRGRPGRAGGGGGATATAGGVPGAGGVGPEPPPPLELPIVPQKGALPAFGRELGLVLERIEEALEAPGASKKDLRHGQGEEQRDDEERRGSEPSRRAPAGSSR